MRLCFGFVLKTVLIIQESRTFLLLTPPHQQAGWGSTRSWERTQLVQLTRTDQRGTSYHMMSCSAHKDGERRRKGASSEWWRLSSQVTVMCDGALPSWRWLNTCLQKGSSEWIPHFVLLACAAFDLPVKLSLTQPMSFSTFTLPNLSPIPPGGNEWLCLVAVWD